MIVPMKKILLIVQSKDALVFLNKLREFGGLHIDREELTISKVQSDELLSCQKAIEILERRIGGKTPPLREPSSEHLVDKPEHLIDRIVTTTAKIEELQKTIYNLKARIAELEPFGSFSPERIRELEKQNIHIKLYRLTKKQLDAIPDNLFCKQINKKDGIVFTAILWCGNKPQQAFGCGVELPEYSLSVLRDIFQRKEEELKSLESILDSSIPYLLRLKKHLKYLEEEKQVTDLINEMPRRERLSLLQGWCPQNRTDELKQLAAIHGCGFLIRDLDPDDQPPTLLKLPAWLEMCRLIFRLINIIPGYGEYDVSFPFLLYMGIFFGILIGDAGYGLLLIVVCLIFQWRRTSLPQPALNLGYFFGLTTIIWGTLTGNWFGVEDFSRVPLISKLTISSLNAFSLESQSLIMLLCFVIGASHISLAHIIACLGHMRSWKVFSQLGWISVIWGIFLVVRHLVLENPLPSFTMLLIGGGLLLVILFTSPQKNIAKGILAGLAAVPMKLMNCFSDIISYIRLFAVGMATLAVAASFNEIAANIGFDSPVRVFGTAAILISGHGINILMGALSVVVHGLRLNMLEFSGHLNMQWSGVEYQPFIKTKSEK